MTKNSEQSFKIFDAHSKDLHGCPTHLGNVLCLPLKELKKKRGWQPNLNVKDKKLQVNQQNVEKRNR